MTWKQTTDRKFDNEIHNTPSDVGPGLYDVTPVIGNRKPFKAPFGTRSGREVFPKSKEEVPPPGSYEAKLVGSEIKISSVFHSNSKRSYFNPISTPDPTSYSRQSEWCKSVPTKEFHKRPTPEARPLTVFYGQKGVNGFRTNKKGEWVPVKEKEKGPEELGPGTYNPTFPLDTKLHLNINQHGSREVFEGMSIAPGPGEYVPSVANKRKLLPVISKSRTKDYIPDDVPEFINPRPWVSPDDVRQPTAVFRSKDERDTFKVATSTPGPAAYYRSSKVRDEYFDNSCFGIRSERKLMDVTSTVPGPGQYTIKDTMSSTKGIKIHTLIKDPPSVMAEVPGPGSYNDPRSIKRPAYRPTSVFTCKIPRAVDSSTEVPGPGRYTPMINDKSRAVPISIKENSRDGSWVNKAMIDNPAPTAYQHIINDPRGGLTISRLDRKDDTDHISPGPGHYDVIHGSMLHKSFNSGVPNLEII